MVIDLFLTGKAIDQKAEAETAGSDAFSLKRLK
jgi:hypothetical protein